MQVLLQQLLQILPRLLVLLRLLLLHKGTNTTQIATTAFVNAEINAYTANLASLASPNFTGIPVARGDGSSTDGQIQLNCSQNSHGVKIVPATVPTLYFDIA